MSHITDLFCRLSLCFREHMISFCLSWNRNTVLICTRDDASAICEGKQMEPGGAPLLVFFFSPRNINFHMVLKIVSVGWVQTTPLQTSAPLTGASEGLLWSGFRLIWGHFPERVVNQRICHTKSVRAYAARHAVPPLERRTRHQKDSTHSSQHIQLCSPIPERCFLWPALVMSFCPKACGKQGH